MKKIFVSSTFRDMQYERDVINNIIMPKLKEKCKRFGEEVYFVDLRWGIDTSDVSDVNLDNIDCNVINEREKKAEYKILNSCMNAIDDCDYFLVLLGDRYGSKIDLTQVYKKNIYNGMSEDNYTHEKSVTEFEIDYGPLNINHNELLQKTIFMFRDQLIDAPKYMHQDGNSQKEIEENDAKLKSLKRRIINYTNEFGGKVINYSLKWNKEQKKFEKNEEFCNILINEFYSMVQKENEPFNELSDYDQEKILNERYIEKNAKKMVYRKDLAKKIIDKINKRNTIYLYGDSQSGKTVLSSYIVKECTKLGYNVAAFFYESSSKIYKDIDMLRHWCAYIGSILKKELKHYSVEEYGDNEGTLDVYEYYNNLLRELLKEYDKNINTPLLLVSDTKNGLNYHTSFIVEKYKKISFLFSFWSFREKFFDKGCQFCLKNYPICTEDYIPLELLNHNKTLSKEVINIIIENNKENNPLYSTLIIQRLLMMDENDFIITDNKVDDVIKQAHINLIRKLPLDIGELYLEIVEEIADRLGFEQIINISILLSLCSNLLTKEDIIQILSPITNNFDERILDDFICSFPLLFEIDVNQSIRFDHSYISEALKNKYDINPVMTAALNYFTKKQDIDSKSWMKIIKYNLEFYVQNIEKNYEHALPFMHNALDAWIASLKYANVYNADEHLMYLGAYIMQYVRETSWYFKKIDVNFIFKFFESFKIVKEELGSLIYCTYRDKYNYIDVYIDLYEHIYLQIKFDRGIEPVILERNKLLFEKLYLTSVGDYFRYTKEKRLKGSITPFFFKLHKMGYDERYNRKDYIKTQFKLGIIVDLFIILVIIILEILCRIFLL